MNKKQRKEMPKPRGTWAINPKTRVKASAKVFSRQKEKQQLYNDLRGI